MALTEIHGNAYMIPMPLNKHGHGPASPDETVLTRYEVWDQVCQTVCVCSSQEDAEAIAELINQHWSQFYERRTETKPSRSD